MIAFHNELECCSEVGNGVVAVYLERVFVGLDQIRLMKPANDDLSSLLLQFLSFSFIFLLGQTK